MHMRQSRRGRNVAGVQHLSDILNRIF